MDRARLASATFEEIWSGVVDPLYIEAASAPGTPPSRPELVLDVLSLWMLHSVAARSGLGSLVAEEPPWMAGRITDAARRLGLDDVAELWERATRAMDLPQSAGKIPARVRFTNPAAKSALEDLLVKGGRAELNRWLVDQIRARSELFAR